MINYFQTETHSCLQVPDNSKRECVRSGEVFCVTLILWHQYYGVQRQTKGTVEAFDVRSFCVQASWLLMRQPASLSELCEALTQPHGGTASSHCSEATNCSSLAPYWDQRPTQSHSLMAPRGHRIVQFGQNYLRR